MTITGLNHINIRAEQPLLKALKIFYRDILGLAEGHRPPFQADGCWLYAGAAPVLHLYEAVAGQNCPVSERGPLDHVAFDCDDLAGMKRLLEEAGVPFQEKALPETGHPQLFLFDPAGVRIELQFQPPSADGIDDGA